MTSWGNPFRRKDENTRTVWGVVTFQLDPKLHLTPAQMEPLKFSYDRLGEQALGRLQALSKKSSQSVAENPPRGHGEGSRDGLPPVNEPSVAKVDLISLLKEHASNDPILGQLWTEVNTVPAWVDWNQISRGQDVFYRYGGPALTGLAFQSLLGGMGAPRVVETLARTGGFSTKVARHRLYETTQHILQCTRSLESIQPGGEGHIASIRVRLLHAMVRQRIVKLAEENPDYYDVQKFGIPINDLDSVGTIATFSSTLIWLSLPRQGIWMRQQEICDFIALWRYIAYLTGTPQVFFSTPEKAKAIMEALLLHELCPTDTSRILANNVIRSLELQPPSYASRSMLEANARFLNGNELCDALGLGRPSLYYWMLVAGQCIFFMAICYSYRSISYLDRRKIKVRRRPVTLKAICVSQSTF